VKFLTPPPDQPELFDWWRPLLAVSRRLRLERVPWPIHVDEFRFCGRFERRPRPAVWAYEHRATKGVILADWSGQTYRFIEHRRGRQAGRFTKCDVRVAIWRARVPDVVEPIWYAEEVPPYRPDARSSGALVPVPGPDGYPQRYVVPPPTNLN
jgi:hypothetical protein